MSIDEIKKKNPECQDLYEFYVKTFNFDYQEA